jgi:hypothetical protein
MQFENNKKQRRNIFAQAAQAAAKANDWNQSTSSLPPPVPIKDTLFSRVRSGSGTSRTTDSSDSGNPESIHAGQLSSSPSQPSTGSSSYLLNPSSNVATFSSGTTKGSMIGPSSNLSSALSPVANRMLERGAEAMEKYRNRDRSGSQGTTSTDNRSQNGSQFVSAGPSSNGDDITALRNGAITSSKLRTSASAAQLRTDNITVPESRNRSDIPVPVATTTQASLPSRPSLASTLRSIASMDRLKLSEPIESFTGPPENFSRFPDPPSASEGQIVPPTNGRRKAFHLLSKPLQTFESASGANHRRGMSSTSVRGS